MTLRTDVEKLAHQGAVAMAEAIAKGQVSSREIIEASLSRIAARNADLHAFITVLDEEARTEAAFLDAMLARGHRRGPLHGVPVAVKDIIDVGGVKTRAGSVTRDHLPAAASDAWAVSRLRAAGAIVIGKTHTVEYAFGGWGTNVVAGTPKNPFDATVHRVPGGSSSGSGVAVGAGLVPLAFGSDTGGSVRLPAGWCGTVGHKTSIGLVGRTGVVPLVSLFDTIGPLTRTVRDAAVMTQVMLGSDPNDASTTGQPALDLLSGLEAGVKGLTIGLVEYDHAAQCDPAIEASVEAAARKLEQAGARLVRVRMPMAMADYAITCGDLMMAEAYWRHGALANETPCRLGAPVARRMLGGKTLAATAYVAGIERRRAEIVAAHQRIEGMDVLILPSTAQTAIPVADVDESGLPGLFTRFVNYLDWCAISLPGNPSPTGLPIGVQIVGRLNADALVLRVARSLEKTMDGPAPLP